MVGWLGSGECGTLPAGSGGACRTMQEWLRAGSLLATVMTNALPVRAERYARQRQRPRHATRAASCELRRELTFDLFGTSRRTGSSSSGVGNRVWAADGDGAETCVVVGGTRSVADATAGQRVSTNLGFRRRALPLSCHQQGRVELQRERVGSADGCSHAVTRAASTRSIVAGITTGSEHLPEQVDEELWRVCSPCRLRPLSGRGCRNGPCRS